MSALLGAQSLIIMCFCGCGAVGRVRDTETWRCSGFGLEPVWVAFACLVNALVLSGFLPQSKDSVSGSLPICQPCDEQASCPGSTLPFTPKSKSRTIILYYTTKHLFWFIYFQVVPPLELSGLLSLGREAYSCIIKRFYLCEAD